MMSNRYGPEHDSLSSLYTLGNKTPQIGNEASETKLPLRSDFGVEAIDDPLSLRNRNIIKTFAPEAKQSEPNLPLAKRKHGTLLTGHKAGRRDQYTSTYVHMVAEAKLQCIKWLP